MKRAERSDQNYNYEPSGKANFRPTTSNVNGPNQMTGQMVQQQTPLPQMSPSINTGYHNASQFSGAGHAAATTRMARPQTQYSHSQQQQQQQYSQQLGFNSQSPKKSSDPTIGSETNTGSTTPG
ncbi:hypothetical protein F4815DRAFT_447645 [Daldinia loculata]|nr:hypothetical protein F4815DRAFT_447645 [Daldinia loculata]